MDDTDSDDDRLWLARIAADERCEDVPEAVLARLERAQRLMRGWGQTHVVTARGRAYLAESDHTDR
jgi:hypothetical protein